MRPPEVCLVANFCLMACAAIMIVAGQPFNIAETLPFDMDSEMVGLNNQCSTCTMHMCTNMPGDVEGCYGKTKGYSSANVWNVWKGIIQWQIEDDQEMLHTLTIPNLYYFCCRNVCSVCTIRCKCTQERTKEMVWA